MAFSSLPFSLSILVVWCSILAPVDSQEVAFFSLNLIWPGGFCNKPTPVCCKPTSNYPRFDFLVRNLVPHAKSGIIPSSCKNPSQFDINNLQNIREKLQQYWELISCPSSDGVQAWEYAWSVYGKCSGFTQKEYFSKALELRSKANLLDSLDLKGIQPSNYQSYEKSKFASAINERLGVKASVICGSYTDPHVTVISICLDKTATNFINCPFGSRTACAEKVTFDPFTVEMLKEQKAMFHNLTQNLVTY